MSSTGMRGSGPGNGRRRIFRVRSLLALGLLVTPACAFADVGTPLMFAGSFQLFIGNLLIGLFEAGLLIWLFKTPIARTCRLMVGANYFSMILGLFGIGYAAALVDRPLAGRSPLENGPTILVCVAVASLLLSILAEWPFTHLALEKDAKDWRRSLKMSVVAQGASYAVLIPIYLAASSVGIYTGATVRHDLSFVRPPLAWVYYLNPDDKGLWRIRTDGTQKALVREGVWTTDNDRLSPDRHPDLPKWDLNLVRSDPGSLNHSDVITSVLLTDFATTAGRWLCYRRHHEMDEPPAERNEEGVWFSFGPAADMRPKLDRPWVAGTGSWSTEGVFVENSRPNGALDRFAVEAPFLVWPSRCATVLPAGQIVYQLGKQIVILDPESREIGFLTMGQGPAVGMD